MTTKPYSAKFDSVIAFSERICLRVVGVAELKEQFDIGRGPVFGKRYKYGFSFFRDGSSLT